MFKVLSRRVLATMSVILFLLLMPQTASAKENCDSLYSGMQTVFDEMSAMGCFADKFNTLPCWYYQWALDDLFHMAVESRCYEENN